MLGDSVDDLLVRQHVRPRDVEGAARGPRLPGRTREVLDPVALVDRLRAVAAPLREREEAKALDETDEQAEGAGAGADHDRRAEGDRARHGLEKYPLDL